MGKEYWYVDILLVIDTDTRTRPRPRPLTSNTKAHSKDFCYGKVSRCEGRVTRSRFIYYIKTEMHPAGLFCRGGGTTGWGSQRGKGRGRVLSAVCLYWLPGVAGVAYHVGSCRDYFLSTGRRLISCGADFVVTCIRCPCLAFELLACVSLSFLNSLSTLFFSRCLHFCVCFCLSLMSL